VCVRCVVLFSILSVCVCQSSPTLSFTSMRVRAVSVVLGLCLLAATVAATQSQLQAESLVQADAQAMAKLQSLVDRFHSERDEEDRIRREMEEDEERHEAHRRVQAEGEEENQDEQETHQLQQHRFREKTAAASSSYSPALVETRSQAALRTEAHESSESGGGGGPFGPCKTCVFVLERIKKGTNMLLPAICSEIYISFPGAYAICHQVLNALSLNGNNVRYWLFEGCYKYEIYQAKEWVKPCPSHVMCTVLKTLQNKSFCKPLPMEDPFKEDSAGGE